MLILNILPEKDYNTYQAILPLQFNLSFQNDIAHDDISRTVLEITGGINLNKYIDFTNRTGVFKPGYNVQMGVSSEYIRHIYISADANDMKTYIPFMDGYYDAYKTYPKIVDADAGYGCYNNYGYNSIHHIEQYLKYPGYEKEKEKKTKKNQFKSFQMNENENGEIICPA